jgi:hypothetical protein
MSQSSEESSSDKNSQTGTGRPLLRGGWRAASKTLPPESEHGEPVLVAATHIKGPHHEERVVLKARHFGSGKFESDETRRVVSTSPTEGESPPAIYYRVTHWCPLPPIPESIAPPPEAEERADKVAPELRRMRPDS